MGLAVARHELQVLRLLSDDGVEEWREEKARLASSANAAERCSVETNKNKTNDNKLGIHHIYIEVFLIFNYLQD